MSRLAKDFCHIIISHNRSDYPIFSKITKSNFIISCRKDEAEKYGVNDYKDFILRDLSNDEDRNNFKRLLLVLHELVDKGYTHGYVWDDDYKNYRYPFLNQNVGRGIADLIEGKNYNFDDALNILIDNSLNWINTWPNCGTWFSSAADSSKELFHSSTTRAANRFLGPTFYDFEAILSFFTNLSATDFVKFINAPIADDLILSAITNFYSKHKTRRWNFCFNEYKPKGKFNNSDQKFAEAEKEFCLNEVEFMKRVMPFFDSCSVKSPSKSSVFMIRYKFRTKEEDN